jgi:site-specific DNA-methyltransferase (adenine-specific)/adenine-specific DNA-methyltransferase|tara:strand:+ start:4343 stop:6400 length:2058 start_codon:yes stop_codon:yes gene_type:complete
MPETTPKSDLTTCETCGRVYTWFELVETVEERLCAPCASGIEDEDLRLLELGEEISPEWARILFPPEKREYELVYHGKEREEDILANTLAVPLQQVRTFGKNGDDWHNKLIFGDNLQVMKSLLEMKNAGELCNADGTPGVRVVYIDPPFATKQEFTGTEDQKAYQDKIAGAVFVEFLRKRLVLFRELLSIDGAIYVHLDWKKVHYVKCVMDEIFGESAFRNEIIWHFPGREMHISNKFNAKHETLLLYARSTASRIRMESVAVPYDRQERLKGLRRKVHKDSDGREWVWETRGQAAGQEPYKRYVDDIVAQGRPLSDVWADLQFLRGNHPERTGYPTQKPASLIQRVVKASSEKGDIVLDAFAGSGTTCAVAEKLGRRWIGIDCGKLAIYTIQKRMLNLRAEIGNKGRALKPKPFTLYNAGLYDFSVLRELPWESWRFFALQLFQCRDQPHKIGGIQLDGYLKGASVLVFNHQKEAGVRIDEDTIDSLHEALGSRVGSKLFIVAPSLTFDFQQDYIDCGDVRYYALRIPYSIIHELHQREFTALKQPSDELAFDFVRSPELKYSVGVNQRNGELLKEAFIRVTTFKSEAAVREPMRKRGNRETLSLLMLDYDFDTKSDVFDLDTVFYAEEMEKNRWEARFPVEPIGEHVMAVFVDIYGNEARELIPGERFTGQREEAQRPERESN